MIFHHVPPPFLTIQSHNVVGEIPKFFWLVVDLPLWKMMEWVSQLGLLFNCSQLFLESHNPFHGSSHHQSGLIPMKSPFSYGFPMVFPRLSVRKIHLGQPGSSKHWGCVYAPFPSPLSNVSTPQTWDRSKGVWFFWKTRLRSKLGTMEFDAYFSWWFRMTTVVIHGDWWWLLVVQPTTTGNYRDLITINHGLITMKSPFSYGFPMVFLWNLWYFMDMWTMWTSWIVMGCPFAGHLASSNMAGRELAGLEASLTLRRSLFNWENHWTKLGFAEENHPKNIMTP